MIELQSMNYIDNIYFMTKFDYWINDLEKKEKNILNGNKYLLKG